MKKNIIILLFCVILLITVDLLTGIYFWNRSHLNFNSQNFNNIVTPIVSAVAAIIYALALKTTLRQNKIILSQNIKPHFERNIDELFVEAKTTKVGARQQDDSPLNFTLLNYPLLVKDLVLELAKNRDFEEDYKTIFKEKNSKSTDYFSGRSYYPVALELNGFLIGNFSITFFYDKINNLMDEIESSQLIDDDKEHLIKRVKQTFLNEYMSLVSFFEKNKNIIPPIPFVLGYDNEAEFHYLTESEGFRKHYDIFTKRFSKQINTPNT